MYELESLIRGAFRFRRASRSIEPLSVVINALERFKNSVGSGSVRGRRGVVLNRRLGRRLGRLAIVNRAANC